MRNKPKMIAEYNEDKTVLYLNEGESGYITKDKTCLMLPSGNIRQFKKIAKFLDKNWGKYNNDIGIFSFLKKN